MFRKFLAIASIACLLASPALAQVGGTTNPLPNITTASIGTSASMAVVGYNPTRRALQVCNGHASQSLTMTFGSAITPVSVTTGVVIAAGTCFTTPAAINNGVGAQVNLIASGASTPATILEY